MALTKFAAGTRVVVNGSHDAEQFENEAGVVVATPPWLTSVTSVRFDRHRDSLHEGNGGDNGHHWYFSDYEDGYTITPEASSTYLNKFKVGDKVRVIDAYPPINHGEVYEVDDVSSMGPSVHLRGTGQQFWWWEARFEKVTTDGPSTYLNGLDPFAPRHEWSVDALPKFKVGDTVRLLPEAQRKRKGYGADDGATAKVTRVSDHHLWVDWLDDKRHGQGNGDYPIHDFALVETESDRPRFMTAWITDDEASFHPTGDAFKTLEAAEAFAAQTLRDNGTDDQIAVFEIRSVHLARLTVTKEVA